MIIVGKADGSTASNWLSELAPSSSSLAAITEVHELVKRRIHKITEILLTIIKLYQGRFKSPMLSLIQAIMYASNDY